MRDGTQTHLRNEVLVAGAEVLAERRLRDARVRRRVEQKRGDVRRTGAYQINMDDVHCNTMQHTVTVLYYTTVL